MKKERRHNSRIPVHIPVQMSSRESGAQFKVNTTDLGEGGLAVSLPRRSKPHGRWLISFTLPGTVEPLEVEAEFAWEGTGTQVGLRFQNQSAEFTRKLNEWLSRNSPSLEMDDPPVSCQLTDLSLGGCYLEVGSPFPVSTRVTLSMRAAELGLKTEGVVRVMHAEKGMGVEFIRSTSEHRALLEKFLSLLTGNRDLLPELMVEPEGFETEQNATADSSVEEDALISLFRSHSQLSAESFVSELRKQRGIAPASAASA
jgi:c-di-GMP-binding flagellar brake protein YcgR